MVSGHPKLFSSSRRASTEQGYCSSPHSSSSRCVRVRVPAVIVSVFTFAFIRPSFLCWEPRLELRMILDSAPAVTGKSKQSSFCLFDFFWAAGAGRLEGAWSTMAERCEECFRCCWLKWRSFPARWRCQFVVAESRRS